MTWLAAAVALAVGYVLGRARLGIRIVNWAEDAATPGWRTWRFWPAAPVVLAAIACVWIVHPRRSLANVRSWRRATGPDPVPQYDPEWAAKRRTGGPS